MKPKRINKTKDQLILEAQQKQHQATIGKFIDTEFMPVMEGVAESIEEAQGIVDSLKIRIGQVFQNKSKTMKLAELDMDNFLRKDAHGYDKFLKVVNVLSDMTVEDSLLILQGIVDETNRVAWNLIKDKKLQDFKENAPRPNPSK